MMSLPPAVIFDWDNTLVNSWGAITAALNKVRAMKGLETWSVEEAPHRSARPLRVSFPEWFGDEWERMRDIFYAHYKEIHLKELKIMSGAQELISWLAQQDVPLFVVSSKDGTGLRAEVEHLGWSPYFKGVIGSTDVPHDKPHRQAVEAALHKGTLRPEDPAIWFVGDTALDVETALRSGLTPVLISGADFAASLGIKLHFRDCHSMKSYLSKG
ncbi:MAG: HAD family hydrolase [Alphaproteobacteria bacterium]|nr:HAD family hydrolase [Alphaproteobacteria bacterium]